MGRVVKGARKMKDDEVVEKGEGGNNEKRKRLVGGGAGIAGWCLLKILRLQFLTSVHM